MKGKNMKASNIIAVAYLDKKQVAIFTKVNLSMENNYVTPAPYPTHHPSCKMNAKAISTRFKKYNISESTKLHVYILLPDADILEGDFCLKCDQKVEHLFHFELDGALTKRI